MVRNMKFISSQVFTLMILIALLMPVVLVPGVSQITEVQVNTTPTVNIRDYIQFGKYNNSPILRRVIH
jgi:hypothetical protein